MASMAVAIAGAWALPGCSAFAAAPLVSPRSPRTMPLGGSSVGDARPGGASAEAQRDVHVHCTLGAAALSAALLAGHRKLQAPRLAAGASRVRLGAAQQPSPQGTKYSTAVPFLPVPQNLTNEPLNTVLPGDYGFDPLGFTSENSPFKDVMSYFTDVCDNFGLPAFDSIRWYREAELMHGRVAMLASFNIIVRESGDVFGVLPDAVLEQAAFAQFASIMAVLEAYRGTRLLLNSEALAGDLGLGMGPGDIMAKEMTVEELAAKQLRELQNGRLAMVGIVGMAVQYLTTGHLIIQPGELQSFEETLLGLPGTPGMENVLLTSVGLVIAADGIRRLSNVTGGAAAPAAGTNEIARKALNPFAITAGVQDPCIPLPTGVVAGAPPQQLALTEAQIVQFEEDGVIMIKGGMKHWVEYLSNVTDHQIAHPHVWSLVGRMSGLYDYIQRNMWMTNDGFRNFFYYSPLGHVLSQLSRSEEVRISTDMLLVNPNKGFGWHQDNQNGPIDFPDAIRWWVAMDKCGENNYGAPEYLKGSHRNSTVSKEAVFVDVKDGDLPQYTGKTDYVPEPGDLIIWDARTIHRIVAPPGQNWAQGTKRRAFGGTAARGGAIYLNKGGASAISDLAGHVLEGGEPLSGPYFPRIYPCRDPEEEAVRARGEVVGRSAKKIVNLGINLASNAGKYISFTKVVGKKA